MFGKREDILMLEERPALSAKVGGAMDSMAVIFALAIVCLGVAQFAVPLLASPITGIETDMAGAIVAAQWVFAGVILAVGGLLRIRPLAIFASEFLLMIGSVGALVILINTQNQVALLVHFGVAAIGLVNAGLARLTDRAEIKRELRLARATAAETARTAGLGATDVAADASA